MRDRRLALLGWLALAAFAIHAANHVRRGEAHDLLWVCNVSPLALGLGCLLGRSWLVAVPVLWLCFGTPLWVLDLLGGGELIWTSFLPHVGGLSIGLLALQRLGVPRGAWWRAAIGLGGLVGLSRLLTPARYNVNVAFAVWAGWEHIFPRHDVYLAMLLGCAACVFWIGERLLVWLAGRRFETNQLERERRPHDQQTGT